MRSVIGAMGWIALATLVAGLGACDDAKDTCENICEKVGECAGEAEAEQNAQMVSDCKAQCGKGGEEISDAEKKRMEKAKDCLDKDCQQFATCIGTI